MSDPSGHSFGMARPRPAAPDPVHWEACDSYLYGIDLFNHGYYWEAHEVWEGLWHACGRTGLTASFLKALIKLAAAGVKVREGKPQGVRSHAGRARVLFEEVVLKLQPEDTSYMGLRLQDLIAYARETAHWIDEGTRGATNVVEVVFPFALRPQQEKSGGGPVEPL